MAPKHMSARKFSQKKLSYKSKLGVGVCPTPFSFGCFLDF